MIKNDDMGFPPLQRYGIGVCFVYGDENIVMEVEGDFVVEEGRKV
jgi:hypothetical protein